MTNLPIRLDIRSSLSKHSKDVYMYPDHHDRPGRIGNVPSYSCRSCTHAESRATRPCSPNPTCTKFEMPRNMYIYTCTCIFRGDDVDRCIGQLYPKFRCKRGTENTDKTNRLHSTLHSMKRLLQVCMIVQDIPSTPRFSICVCFSTSL